LSISHCRIYYNTHQTALAIVVKHTGNGGWCMFGICSENTYYQTFLHVPAEQFCRGIVPAYIWQVCI